MKKMNKKTKMKKEEKKNCIFYSTLRKMSDLVFTIKDDEEIDYNDESEEINENDEENLDNDLEVSQNNFFDGEEDSEEVINIRTKISETIKQEMKLNEKRNSGFATTVDQKVEVIKRREENKDKYSVSEESSDEEDEQKDEDEEGGDLNEEKKREKEKVEKEFYEKIEKSKKELNRRWEDLNLSKPLMKAITELGWAEPSPIQSITIPRALNGKDICASAVTGSGKTGAFILPVLERLLFRNEGMSSTRVLIMEPTRELAIQAFEVLESLCTHTNITCSIIVGGLSEKLQKANISKRPDVIVATPGRLIDHLINSKSFDLDSLEILILDEADRLLELGFEDQIHEVLRFCPVQRQTMLFSATMSSKVDKLISLSLKKPLRISVDPIHGVSRKLVQEFVRVKGKYESFKEGMLLSICAKSFKTSVIIFFHTKRQAHRMKIIFSLFGLSAAELHGNLSQNQRLEALQSFKEKKVEFLLTTNLAARGIDVTGIETVINYNMPSSLKKYIHRVGRTARAGRAGRSVSFVSNEEKKLLKKIIANKFDDTENKLKQREIPVQRFKKWSKRIEGIEKDIDRVLFQEKHEKQLRIAQMELSKAQNLIDHQDEIYARPKKEWFQSTGEKTDIKDALLDNFLQKDTLDPRDMEIVKRRMEEKEKEKEKKRKRNHEGDNENDVENYDEEFLKKKKLDDMLGLKYNKESGKSRKKRRAMKLNEMEGEEDPNTKKLVERSIREGKKKNKTPQIGSSSQPQPKKKNLQNRDQFLENTYFPEIGKKDPLQAIKGIFSSEMQRASLKVQKTQDSYKSAKRATKQLMKEDEVERKKLEEFDVDRHRSRRKKKGVKKFKSLSRYKRKK
eukprot:TRINITY_DN4938_c1_g1_i1.p1 TRINITY_DN4938_c1_g1~~TRINITY_DN4938_c1_g1_i1.p1  ORF type:complete len:850 (+),score=335.73 TRINITY_DN4938_c1_g1_i1:376-2925(+)